MALFTSALLYNWLEQQRASRQLVEPQVVSLPPRMVAVAAGDLPWGTTLTTSMIKLVAFPSASLLEGYFSTVESVSGRILLTNIKANDPFLEDKFAPPEVTQGGMAVVTQMGKRAMAVRVDDVVGVAGFINPGNRVDVLVTLRQEPPQTRTVLQNILVLATGTQLEAQSNGSKAREARVITLEVTPEEAEKLVLAAHEGKVTMALRNYANLQPAVTRGATLSTLLNTATESRERVPVKISLPTFQAPPTRVEIIKGGTVQTLTFQKP
jgi:pilus assembly protein CpaB